MKLANPFLLLPFAWLMASSFSFADVLAENQARFGTVQGTVQLLSQGARTWIDAHEGLPLESGDEIQTGDDGQADLVVSPNALWQLQPQTDVVAGHLETSAGRFNLLAGLLIGKVDSKRAVQPQRWEFDTPLAVCSVRGTEFAVVVSTQEEEETRLAVYAGEVEIQPAETAAGEQPAMIVGAGREAVAARGKTLKIEAKFSPALREAPGALAQLRKHLRRVQDTWSPFTPDVRKELRRKFVAPPPKPAPSLRPIPRPRRAMSS